MLGYDSAVTDGGDLEPYTYLLETFLPTLAGVDEETIRRLTRDNPFDAFARQARPDHS